MAVPVGPARPWGPPRRARLRPRGASRVGPGTTGGRRAARGGPAAALVRARGGRGWLRGGGQWLIHTGANTLLIWTHGAKVGPYMNGLHFCFGLGACGLPSSWPKVIGGAGGCRWAYWTLAAVMTLVSLSSSSCRGIPAQCSTVSGHARPEYSSWLLLNDYRCGPCSSTSVPKWRSGVGRELCGRPPSGQCGRGRLPDRRVLVRVYRRPPARHSLGDAFPTGWSWRPWLCVSPSWPCCSSSPIHAWSCGAWR